MAASLQSRRSLQGNRVNRSQSAYFGAQKQMSDKPCGDLFQSLKDNTVTKQPDYRLDVIHKLKHLRLLDFKNVKYAIVLWIVT